MTTAEKTEPVDTEVAPELIAVDLGNDVTVHVYADARDDFEILDEVSRLEDGDMTRLPALMRRLMPEVDRRAALATVRGANGRVTLDSAMDLVRSLFVGMNNPN